MVALIVNNENYHFQIEERLRRLDPSIPKTEPGCKPRRTLYGACPFAAKATDFIQPIPRALWPQLIIQGNGNWLHDSTKLVLPPHDQGRTNLCWVHGSVRTAEALRIFEGQNPLLLSGESLAFPITGGRNRGGYPEEALQGMIETGPCRQDLWPLNELTDRNANPAWRENGKFHRLLRWVEVEDFDMQFTLALMRIPVAIGLGWWSHLVCQLDPIMFADGTYGIGCDNSWGPDYGDNGYFVLTESRGTADLGAFAPLAELFAAA